MARPRTRRRTRQDHSGHVPGVQLSGQIGPNRPHQPVRSRHSDYGGRYVRMVLAPMTMLLGIPVLGALLLLIAPKRLLWATALLASFATLLAAVALNFPQTIRYSWIPAIGAQFLLH